VHSMPIGLTYQYSDLDGHSVQIFPNPVYWKLYRVIQYAITKKSVKR